LKQQRVSHTVRRERRTRGVATLSGFLNGSNPLAPGLSSQAALRLGGAVRWAVALVSAAILTAYMAWFVHLQEMDFQVYRMGGQHALGAGLYSSEITVIGRHLLFTYPPIAALVFWPFSQVSIHVGQAIWDAIDLVALTALIAVSVAAAQKRSVLRSDWKLALILLAPIGLLLYPVRENLVLGQINILLVLMIVSDLTIGVSWRGRRLPKGLLVGVACAIKLTPLVFIPYLVLTRQWRAARNAVLTFVVATSAMFAIAPRSSWSYFTNDAFDLKRVGDAGNVGNQTLREALLRAHVPLSAAAYLLVATVVLCSGLAVAVVAHRHSSALLGVLLCGATGLLTSPVSWVHHYVWIVPALIWLLVGVDRPVKGAPWTIAGALIFIVIQPGQVGGVGLMWYLRDDAYVISTLAFFGLVGASLLIAARRKLPDEENAASNGDRRGELPATPVPSGAKPIKDARPSTLERHSVT